MKAGFCLLRLLVARRFDNRGCIDTLMFVCLEAMGKAGLLGSFIEGVGLRFMYLRLYLSSLTVGGLGSKVMDVPVHLPHHMG